MRARSSLFTHLTGLFLGSTRVRSATASYPYPQHEVCSIILRPLGQSLDETKALVRKKLGLEKDASVRFARLHEGKVIELDDGEPISHNSPGLGS